MDKKKFIIFEGVDKVGKTTIYQAFRKRTNYAPLCIDRFLGSNFAYDFFFDRENSVKDFSTIEEKLIEIFDCTLVYLTCEEDILMERIREHDEESLELEVIERIKEIDFLFYFYYKRSKFKKIIIDTSHINVRKVVDVIVEFINSEITENDLWHSDKWKVGLGV